MFSNERPSPYGRRPNEGQGNQQSPKPFVQEDTILSAQLKIERKTFIFALKQNPRGQFLRISESVGGKRDSIIVPNSGLEDFHRILGDMVAAAKALPTPTEEPGDSIGNR